MWDNRGVGGGTKAKAAAPEFPGKTGIPSYIHGEFFPKGLAFFFFFNFLFPGPRARGLLWGSLSGLSSCFSVGFLFATRTVMFWPFGFGFI